MVRESTREPWEAMWFARGWDAALAEVEEAVGSMTAATNDVRNSHAPNEWDSCVACRKTWPCDAELLAEFVLTFLSRLAALRKGVSE